MGGGNMPSHTRGAQWTTCKSHFSLSTHAGSRDQTQITRLAVRYLYTQSYLASPVYFIAVTSYIIMSCALIWIELRFLSIFLNRVGSNG